MGDDHFLCPNCDKEVSIIVQSIYGDSYKNQWYHYWEKSWRRNDSWRFGTFSDRDKIINAPDGLPMIVGKELDWTTFTIEDIGGYKFRCSKCDFTTNDFRKFT